MLDLNPNHLFKECRETRIDYREHFQDLGNGVYSGKIVTDDFCEDILERISHVDAQANAGRCVAANSMHWNALPAAQIGIEPLVGSLVELFDQDIAPNILPERLRLPIDDIHSYIVRYGHSSDRDLGFHIDDSFLTLNICLTEGFTGSELVFEGERCPAHVDTHSSAHERLCVEHQKGSMIVHPGKNRHFVNWITSGERCNLIIWCQNEAERERWFASQNSGECLEFCGELSKHSGSEPTSTFDHLRKSATLPGIIGCRG